MSTVPGAIFTGSSQFSSDFQSVIQRAVSFAQLPIQQMQNDVNALQSQSSEFGTLGARFSALQSAIGTLNNALGLGSYSASATSSVANTTVANVSLSGTPGVGTYNLEVDSIGSYATAMSNDGTSVTDPSKAGISDAAHFTLSIGTGYSAIVTPSTPTLSGLAAAINASSAGVQATVVNVGSTANPDYRLSLQNSKLAATTLQLTAIDGTNPGQALLTKGADGAPTTYRINGKPAADSPALSSDSPNILLSPGITVSMLAAGNSTITVSQNTSALANALSTFAGAYNAADAEIATSRGQGKGALQGQSIVSTLASALRQIANYATGTDGISSLTSLGLSFDKNGVMSFDTTAFNNATAGQMSSLTAFLGATDTGGFLKAANDTLTSITDSTSGLIQSGTSAVQDQITRENANISEQQGRVTNLQNNLNQRMAAADSAIAAMEQQYSYLYNMFQAMQTNARNGG
jgi:flagellar hook-associated protein 2